MMTVFGSSEAEVIESLLPKYPAEGFDVYVNPSPSILPPLCKLQTRCNSHSRRTGKSQLKSWERPLAPIKK